MHTSVEYRPAGSLGKLLLKNAALSLVTLGIYRFWAKTVLRRYLWQAIRIGDDPLEYTGLGRELFVGFLIVLAVLAPLALAWGVTQLLVAGDPVADGFARIVYLLLLYVLIQTARFRARGYRLSRSRWRGIRAGQDGSTLRYIGLSLAWGFLSLVTVGIAFPWMRTALQRYRTTNTRVGDQHLTFTARALPLLTRWLIVLAAVAIPYGLASFLFWQIISPFIRPDGFDQQGMQQALSSGTLTSFGTSLGLMFLAILAGSIAYVWYRTVEFRHFVAHTQLGEVTFRSTLKASGIIGLLILFVLCMLATAVFTPLVLWFFLGLLAQLIGAAAQPLGVALMIFSLVVILFAYTFLWMTIVVTGVLRRVCETLEISNHDALGRVAQATVTAPKFGEGLADSFELAG